MSITEDHRNVPIALWRVASRLMVTLFNLFGEPDALARQHSMSANDYKLACNWLRTVEAFFRRLLFIEASYYIGATPPPKPRAKRKRVCREVVFFPEKPDQWRVTFRTAYRRLPAGNCARTTPRRAKPTGPIFHSVWSLAERFEALLRVHNNPAPFAKRLARRLNAERVGDILNAPSELQHRIDPEAYAEVETLCVERRRVLPSAALNSS